jgi:hypothetical protein
MVVGNEKGGGLGGWLMFPTVAIDVCLLFYLVGIFSSMNFRFVKTS